jgi:hypothetical protein
MKGFNFKKYLPHVLAILIFAGLAIFYFYPVMFENKDLVQGDVTSSTGWGNDLRQYHEQTGEYAFWSNAMFGGMPANYAFMPPTKNIFQRFSNVLKLYLPPLHVGVVFLYLLGFYIFLLALGCSPWLSIIGAIAYALASYNIIIIDAGHVNKGLVMATMAPIIGGIILCYRNKLLIGSLITLFFTGMNVLWNHQQISYYLLLMILVLAIVYFIYAIKGHTFKDFFKSSSILVLVAALAVVPAMDSLAPTADYAKETMRGGAVLKQNASGEKENSGLEIDYAYMWSYGKWESMTLLIPNFYGGSSSYDLGRDSKTYEALRQSGQAEQFTKQAPAYWGDQPGTSGPVYMGAIICFLFVLGLIIVKGPETWWILITTLIALILSWGRNLEIVNEFLFYNLPLYNKFRTPSMALVIAEVSMAALATLAIKEIWNSKDKKLLLKPLYIAAGVTGGICLLFALFGGSMFSFTSQLDTQYQLPGWLIEAMQKDRKSMLTGDAWRSLIYILLAAGMVWLYLKSKLKPALLIGGLGLMILVDLWTVDKRFLNDDSFFPKRTAKAITPTESDLIILQDKDPDYRVINLTTSTFNESKTSYFHKSIGGYSPAKFRRYQDIIDYHMSSRGLNMSVLNMLNTRYFIVPTEKGGSMVQRNPDALGNAWFVDSIQWVNSPDEEIQALTNFNPAKVAVIDTAWKKTLSLEKITSSDTSSIVLTSYSPKQLVYSYEAKNENLAVFSEVFYKTWRAFVDGKEVSPIRVNYILRGLKVPSGKHQIEFKCEDALYEKSSRISIWGSVLVGLVMIGLLVGIYLENRKKKTEVAKK